MLETSRTVVPVVRAHAEGRLAVEALSRHHTIIEWRVEVAGVLAVATDAMPDAVVVDLAITDALGLIDEMSRDLPAVSLLAIAPTEGDELIQAALRGATAMWVGETPDDGLARLVLGVTRNETELTSAVAQALLGIATELAATGPGASIGLTSTERTVLEGYASGRSADTLAAAHDVSPRTIRYNANSALRRVQRAARVRRDLATTAPPPRERGRSPIRV